MDLLREESPYILAPYYLHDTFIDATTRKRTATIGMQSLEKGVCVPYNDDTDRAITHLFIAAPVMLDALYSIMRGNAHQGRACGANDMLPYMSREQTAKRAGEAIQAAISDKQACGINHVDHLATMLESAIVRIEMANAEGDPILSAWLPAAKATLARAKCARSPHQSPPPDATRASD